MKCGKIMIITRILANCPSILMMIARKRMILLLVTGTHGLVV